MKYQILIKTISRYCYDANKKNWGDPVNFGPFQTKNRIVMCSLTRNRAGSQGIPNSLMAQYYSQRSSFGIQLTQSLPVSQRGHKFLGTGCLFNKNQMQGWKKIVSQVHKKGGIFFAQLYHAGRYGNPNKGLQIWAPSPIQISQEDKILDNYGSKMPKQMTLQNIQEVIKEFTESAKLAKEAGFDGVQLHGAHGFLVDSFIRSSSNKRKDKYGGSIQNRCRFCLQTLKQLIQVFENKRVGLKISPVSFKNDMYDDTTQKTYGYLLQQCQKLGIGFIEARQHDPSYAGHIANPNFKKQQDVLPDTIHTMRKYFKGIIIGNNNFDQIRGIEKIRNGDCDMISFGHLSICNPDLPQRILNGWPIQNNPKRELFYTHQKQGYTDYQRYKPMKQKI